MGTKTLSYYEILGIKPDCTIDEIKTAYKEIVKKHHPDKGGIVEIFETATKAYNILKDPTKRSDYDKMYAIVIQTKKGHIDHKQSFNDFMELQEAEKKISKKEDIEKTFDMQCIELDKKHGYDSTKPDEILTAEEIIKRSQNLENARDQDDIEFMPEQIFDGPIDMAKFNALFDKTYGGQNSLDIIPRDDVPKASNVSDIQFCALDTKDLYNEGGTELTTRYSTINDLPFKPSKIKKSDISKVEKAEYYDGHKNKEVKTIEQKLIEREAETLELSSIPMDKYNNDTMGFGVFEGLGKFEKISWDDVAGETLKLSLDKK